MSLETIQIEHQETLKFDKDYIKELQSLITQNKAKGNPVDKFFKQLVAAQEKHVKHLIEYEKWCNENQIQIENKPTENQTTNLNKDQTASSSVNSFPANHPTLNGEFQDNHEPPTKNEQIGLLSGRTFAAFENKIRKKSLNIKDIETLHQCSTAKHKSTQQIAPLKKQEESELYSGFAVF